MRIVSVVCGSIACYKYIDFARSLIKDGHELETILTKSAQQFLTPLLVSSTTGKQCYTEDTWHMEHISLAKSADCILIFAATANFIAGMAAGFANNLGLSLVLARPSNARLVICPAMNVNMWHNPATQRNIDTLKQDGAIFAEPKEGLLACGDYGKGHLASLFEIKNAILNQGQYHGEWLQKKASNLNIVITTGGTIEKIDDVRYISNFSSGIQGIEIAKELQSLGCNVLLICGNISVAVPEEIRTVSVQSAMQMLTMSLDVINHPSKYFENANNKDPIDAFVSCAAVCDFYVANYKHGKVKKQDGLNLEFIENKDIVQTIALLENKRPKKVVAFAAEDLSGAKLCKAGTAKLKKKNVDIMIANSINGVGNGGSIFGAQSQHEVFIIEKQNNNNTKTDKEHYSQIHLIAPSKTQTAKSIAATILGGCNY